MPSHHAIRRKLGYNWAIKNNPHRGKCHILKSVRQPKQIQALVGQHRLAPPPHHGVFPFLSSFYPPKDPLNSIRVVTFAHRRQLVGGGFYDYSSRYGAMREQDRITLRQSILNDTSTKGNRHLLSSLATILRLSDQLDLPLIALSNGQTRRAAVLRQILLRPEVLFLDEPLSAYI
jgi:ABC-type sugar transport system ATPase subunit